MLTKRISALFLASIMVLSIVIVPRQNVYATIVSQSQLITVREGQVFEIRNVDDNRRQGHSVTLTGSRNVFFDYIIYNGTGHIVNGGSGRGATLERITINGTSPISMINSTQVIPLGGKMLIEVRGNGHVAVSGVASNFVVRELQTPVFYTQILNENRTVSFTNFDPVDRQGVSFVNWVEYGHPFPARLSVDRPRNATPRGFGRYLEVRSANGQTISRRTPSQNATSSGTSINPTQTLIISNQTTGNTPAWSVRSMEFFGDYIVFTDQPYRLTLDGQRSFPPSRERNLPPRQSGVPEEYYELYRMLKASNFEMLFGEYTAFTSVYIDRVPQGDVFALGLTSGTRSAMIRGIFTGDFSRTVDNIMNDPQKVQAIVRDLINRSTSTDFYTANKDMSDVITVISSVSTLILGNDAPGIMKLFDALKYADGGAEALSRAAQEYSANIAMLESLRGLTTARLFNETIDNVIREYQKTFAETLNNYGLDIIEGKAINLVVGYLLGKPVVAITSLLNFVISRDASVSGLETIIVTNDINLQIIGAFRNAANKIVSGNFTSADVVSYRNAFYLARNLQILRYSAKRELRQFGAVERNYIDAQLRRLRQMSHDSFVYSVPF